MAGLEVARMDDGRQLMVATIKGERGLFEQAPFLFAKIS